LYHKEHVLDYGQFGGSTVMCVEPLNNTVLLCVLPQENYSNQPGNM